MKDSIKLEGNDCVHLLGYTYNGWEIQLIYNAINEYCKDDLTIFKYCPFCGERLKLNEG